MRVVLTSVGTLGDVQPMFALGVEMARRHHVVMALSPNYRERVQEIGLEFHPTGPAMSLAEIRSGHTKLAAMASGIEQTRFFLEQVAVASDAITSDLRTCCNDADVLISMPHQFAARMVHEQTGIQFVTVSYTPFLDLKGHTLRDATAPVINTCRRRQGLPAVNDPFSIDGLSPELNLHAVSRLVLKRTATWPSHHQVTGFFYLDENQWTPQAELAEFLESGPPPVVLTFSSMTNSNSIDVTTIAEVVLEAIGGRMLLLGGWSDIGIKSPQRRNLFVTHDFVPHNAVFSRSSCIVHHGGAGTTAAALRSGVPAVVVPHMLDQPIWAEVARGLGCAGGVVPHAQLSAERLIKAIANALETPRIREAAKKVAEFIATENGVSTAVGLIERLTAGKSLH